MFIPRLLLAGPGKLCKYLSIAVQQLSGLMKAPKPLGPAGGGAGRGVRRGRLGCSIGEKTDLPADWLCDLTRLLGLSEPQRGLMLNRMA